MGLFSPSRFNLQFSPGSRVFQRKYCAAAPAAAGKQPGGPWARDRLSGWPQSMYFITMIRLTSRLALDERELEFHFIRAAGPGGQNVNKVATAVQLRFDLARSPSLPEPVRRRLARLAGRRLTGGGVLVIEARRFRSQERNRQDALQRLTVLLREAARAPKTRRPTGPTRAARERRLEAKKRRGGLKRDRRGPAGAED